MINFGTAVLIILMLGLYLSLMLLTDSIFRKFLKLIIYTVVFLALFGPDVELWHWGNGIGMNLRFYAIVLAGMEGIDMWVKFILEGKRNSGKQLSERENKILESM